MGFIDSNLCYCDGDRWHHLLCGQSDHVQRAIHESTHHHLLGVFCEHGVIYTVVGSYILSKTKTGTVMHSLTEFNLMLLMCSVRNKTREEFRIFWVTEVQNTGFLFATLLSLTLTLIFTCVLLRSHFSRGLDGVNSDTSFPSSSRMLEFSCLMTCRRNSPSVSLKDEHESGSHTKKWREVRCWLTCLRRKDTTSVDSQYDAWKRCGKATVGNAVRASGQYRAKSSRLVPHQRAATVMGIEWMWCRNTS